jgi:hypothetical protein
LTGKVKAQNRGTRKMSLDKIAIVITRTLFSIAVFICGMFYGHSSTLDDWKTDAVKAGKAEYYLDKDFNKQWRWKP